MTLSALPWLLAAAVAVVPAGPSTGYDTPPHLTTAYGGVHGYERLRMCLPPVAFVGTITEVTSFEGEPMPVLGHKRIYSHLTLEVDQPLRGVPITRHHLVVPGGTVGNTRGMGDTFWPRPMVGLRYLISGGIFREAKGVAPAGSLGLQHALRIEEGSPLQNAADVVAFLREVCGG